MDGSLLAYNIHQMGRTQLLVVVLQRVYRMLSEEDQPRYADLFAPYLRGHALSGSGRGLAEPFRLEQERLEVKEARELSASSLQSLDDLEVTDREKGGKGCRGYVVNVTETCDPENPVQLITQV